MNFFIKEFSHYSDLTKNIKGNYKTFPIEKKSGKLRWIDAPGIDLKNAQLEILTKFLYRFSPHPMATGFIKGFGVHEGAARHIGAKFVINLDLSNFFTSIKKDRVTKLIHHLLLRTTEIDNIKNIDMNEFRKFRDLLVALCTYKNRLPQGACTSPAIANLVAEKLDEQLYNLAEEHDLIYSRYADDLSFSGLGNPDYSVINSIMQIIVEKGFKVNNKKTSIKTSNKRMVVTGIVINKKLGIPKYKKKVFRAKLYNLLKNEIPVSKEDLQKLRGYAEWIKILNPQVGLTFLQQIRRLQVV
ncbi:MAG TPA: reverse transcriptase family protein [Bacteroidales bacterium]|nr:reverse transcriptase family protein [Bacteroidales bacterium]